MIGLIFGETSFPTEILKKLKKKRINYLIIDLTKSKKFKKDKKSFSVSIWQFGKIINILNENKCKKVLFAGKVSKPNFSKLKLDLKGIYYIPRIIKASKIQWKHLRLPMRYKLLHFVHLLKQKIWQLINVLWQMVVRELWKALILG